MNTDHKLKNDEIELRNITSQDSVSNYFLWLKDREINQYLEVRFNLPKNKIELKSYIDSINKSDDSILFGIFHNKTTKHIGNIKLGPINWHHSSGELGLIIGDKKYWGKSYAKQAIKLISEYAFDSLDLVKLSAGCYEDNIGSMKHS